MQIKKTSISKKVIIPVVVALLFIACLVAYAAITKKGPFAGSQTTTTNLNNPSTEQIKAGNTVKQTTIENSDKGTTTGSDPLPSPTPPATPGDKPTVGMEITAANQDGGLLRVRALIQTLSSSGNCKLAMTGPGGKIYAANASVQAVASSTTCQGFDIPVSSLGSGNWKINLTFSNDSYTASASRTVTIQ